MVGHIRDDVYLTKADTQDNKHNPSEWLNRLLEASLVFEGSIFLSERTVQELHPNGDEFIIMLHLKNGELSHLL